MISPHWKPALLLTALLGRPVVPVVGVVPAGSSPVLVPGVAVAGVPVPAAGAGVGVAGTGVGVAGTVPVPVAAPVGGTLTVAGPVIW
jgi:hypothetical protein